MAKSIQWAVEIDGLSFSYPESPLFDQISVKIPVGSRTLLLGGNGVGKSTLLRILGGLHLVPREVLRIRGKSPFYDLATSTETALLEDEFDIHVDIQVSELLAGRQSVKADPKRQKQLMDLLAIDPRWHMHRVSEGQKRRVQLLLALRERHQVLLMDEITTHLDVVARADLLEWLKQDSNKNGTTLIYATHIFDGLWEKGSHWPTHLLQLATRKPVLYLPAQKALKKSSSLYTYCASWIRKNP
jgi:CCR4-NOT complex subunit CAF16